ncbi:MAG: DUF5658 family protein [Methanolinea sp.]|nr:DUF5658 family protein [Methanolinea sp.]
MKKAYQIFMGALFVLLGGLLALDVLLTTLILGLGGFEMNPVMAWVVQNPYIHIGVKCAFAGFIIYMAGRAEELKEYSGALIVMAVCAFFMVVFVHNLAVFTESLFS